jgi:hypothetical protein
MRSNLAPGGRYLRGKPVAVAPTLPVCPAIHIGARRCACLIEHESLTSYAPCPVQTSLGDVWDRRATVAGRLAVLQGKGPLLAAP